MPKNQRLPLCDAHNNKTKTAYFEVLTESKTKRLEWKDQDSSGSSDLASPVSSLLQVAWFHDRKSKRHFAMFVNMCRMLAIDDHK